MFKKPAAYKPATTIRNSDRKALTAEIQHVFPAAFQDKTPEESKLLLDLILPSSGIESSTFTTTKGHRGILYSHLSEAIFIRVEQTLIPTLQTIWKCAALVPTVLTGSQVLTNLQTGSDLMVKGMFEFSPDVKAGSVVGIRITDRTHVVAVGTAAIDFDRIKREDGGKGILTCICLGDTITPEASYPVQITGEDVTPELESLAFEESAKSGASEHSQREEIIESPALTTEEIDEAFVQALLYGLYTLSSTDRQSSLSLPINPSSLIDTYVLPFLPSTHPDLVLKKTTCQCPSG